MKLCKVCNIEKEKCLMVLNARTCRDCKNRSRRTGRPSGPPKGRASPKKGQRGLQVAWNKGLKGCQVAWNKGLGDSRGGRLHKEWSKLVKKRDNYICAHCLEKGGSNLHAHHIVFWEDSKELRFDINNGLTLCNQCHTKLHKKVNPVAGWNKGMPCSEEKKKKISETLKGNIPWNKGMKGKYSTSKKGKKRSVCESTGKILFV